MIRYCSHCEAFSQHNETHCPKCGMAFQLDSGANHFFSGIVTPQDHSIQLDSETTILDRFTLKELLYRGIFTSVYLASDSWSTDVVLKLAPIGPSIPDCQSLLLHNEFLISKQISNFERVIRVDDFYLIPWGGIGLAVLSMEYAEGGTLRQWLLDHQHDWQTRKEQGLLIINQILEGLKCLTDIGVVPIDVKPENCLYSQERVKIADYGAANSLEFSDDGINLHKPMNLSTPIYMSPEHFTASQVSELTVRSLVYSVGIIFYEMVHPQAQPPFTGDLSRLRDAHIHILPPTIPSIDERTNQVIQTCLQKDPAQRFSSISELLSALNPQLAIIESEPLVEDEPDSEDSWTMEEMWESAHSHYMERQFNQANEICQEILTLSPSHKNAKRMTADLQDRFHRAEVFFQKIERGVNTHSLQELSVFLQQAIELYPDHPSSEIIMADLQVKAQLYRQSMEEGREAVSLGQFNSAVLSFKKALSFNPAEMAAVQALEYFTDVRDMIIELESKIIAANERNDSQNANILTKTLAIYIRQIQSRAEQLPCEVNYEN